MAKSKIKIRNKNRTVRSRKKLAKVGESKCRFCRMKNVDRIDYKDVQTLQKLITAQGKLFSRKRSGNCAKHQRSVQKAIKRARYIAILPYVG